MKLGMETKYISDSLCIPTRYTDYDFLTKKDFNKSLIELVFTLSGGSIAWRRVKQDCIANSIMKIKYVVTCEIGKQGVWLPKFLTNLKGVQT